MEALKVIGWFIALLISVALMFETIGMSGLVNMFPEGRRWWMRPAQLASITAFALIVLRNPWL